MPTRDVAQLILEVDARIATAQRAVNQLAKSVQQDSASMEQSLGKVATAHANIGKALNDNSRIRAGFTQLSFQIGDVTQQMSLGVAGARIFAQQSGQVIQALQVMGGEGNKFLQFLGGPWGIAISTAAVILAPFAAKLFDTGDQVGKLVDKMREQAKQAELNRQADEAWKTTIEGLTEAIRKRREEQEKSLQTDIQAEQDSLTGAKTELADAQRKLAQTIRAQHVAEQEAAAAKQAFETAAGAPGTDQATVAGALTALDRAQAKVDSLRKQALGLQQAIFNAEANVRGAEATITERTVANRFDAVKGATDEYTKALGKLRRELTLGAIDQAEYDKRLSAAQATLDRAKKAAQSSNSDRQSGRQIDFGQAEQIARAAGLQVNSGFRSVAEQRRLFNDPSVNRPGNPVAPPGASAHNGANGKWAIDIQITDGVTPGKIRKIFGDQGVSLTKVLKEKGHFHIEGSRSEAAKAENDAARAQTKQVRDDNHFEEQRDRLNQELLQAQGQLIQGISAQAAFAEDQVKADEARSDAAIQNDVEEQKLTQAQADQLKAINASIAAEKIKAIEIGKQVDLILQQDEREQRKFEYQADDLRFADEMARTQAEHRKLQLDILDVVYQEKEAHLRALKAQLLLAGKLEEAADVQTQIDRLPTEKAHDRARTVQGTMNPLEALANQAPKTAAEVIEAMQSIEAQGINSLADAIGEVVTGTKSLGAAFKDVARSIVADIVQMTIKMLIFRALSSVLGGAFGGGGSVTNISGLGSIPGNFVGPRASGGPVQAGMAYLVGEKRPELFVPETNGTILPSVPRIRTPANSNSKSVVEVHVKTDENFTAQVAQVAGAVVTVFKPSIVKDARAATVKSLTRRSIAG